MKEPPCESTTPMVSCESPLPVVSCESPPLPIVSCESPPLPIVSCESPPLPIVSCESPPLPMVSCESPSLPMVSFTTPLVSYKSRPRMSMASRKSRPPPSKVSRKSRPPPSKVSRKSRPPPSKVSCRSPPPMVTSKSPPPMVTSKSPPPMVTSKSPPPMVTSKSPPPMVTSKSPPPMVTSKSPPPMVTSKSPPPMVTSKSPPPMVTSKSPPPMVTSKSPPPMVTSKSPPPMVTSKSPPPMVTSKSPPPMVTSKSPPPMVTSKSLLPMVTSKFPLPVVSCKFPLPVVSCKFPPPVVSCKFPPPVVSCKFPPPVVSCMSLPPPPMVSCESPPPPMRSCQSSSPIMFCKSPSPIMFCESPPIMSGESPPPIMSGESSLPIMSGESSLPIMSCESSLPIMSCESSLPINSCESSLPINSCQSSLPINSCESSLPINSCESSLPINSCESSLPINSCESSLPINSCESSLPINSCESSLPINSCESSLPIMSYESSLPIMSYESSLPIMSYESSLPIMSYESSLPIMSYESSPPIMSCGVPPPKSPSKLKSDSIVSQSFQSSYVFTSPQASFVNSMTKQPLTHSSFNILNDMKSQSSQSAPVLVHGYLYPDGRFEFSSKISEQIDISSSAVPASCDTADNITSAAAPASLDTGVNGSGSEQKENQRKAPITCRSKKKCPDCNKWRVNLPSHMRDIHGWSGEKAAKINFVTNQRKPKSLTKKYLTKRVRCDVENCYSFVFDLKKHKSKLHSKKLTSFYPQNKSEVDILTTAAELEPPELTDSTSAEIESAKSSQNQRSVDNNNNQDNLSGVEAILNDFIQCTQLTSLSTPIAELPTWLMTVLDDFRTWMQGPQGRLNRKETAENNYNQVRRLCLELGVQELKDLLDDTKINRFLMEKQDKCLWKGNTARSYIGAMVKFMSFIIKDGRHNNFSTREEREIALELKEQLPEWSRSYKNRIGLESAVKKIKQADVLLNHEKISKYKSSIEYRTAIKLLGECHRPDFILSMRKFTLMRNFLLFSINYLNANRAGVLCELTVENFLCRKKAFNRETGSNSAIMTVVYHKTLATHGPAKLVLTATQNIHMQLFYEHVRSKLLIDEENPCPFFFTTFKGTSLGGSSSVAQCISSHTSSSGIGKLTSNDCRRSASTITREVDPSMTGAVADHMNHTEAIAARIYNIKNKDVLGVRAAEFIEQMYSGEKKKLCQIDLETMDNRNSPQTEASIELDPNTEVIPSAAMDGSSSSGSIVESSLPDNRQFTDTEEYLASGLRALRQAKSVSSNTSFSQEQRDKLKKLFLPLFRKQEFLSGEEQVAFVREYHPDILKSLGDVAVKAKYRDMKKRFLGGRLH